MKLVLVEIKMLMGLDAKGKEGALLLERVLLAGQLVDYFFGLPAKENFIFYVLDKFFKNAPNP